MSLFNYFKKADLKKTPFNMSNHAPYTCNMGELCVTYLNDTIAGDDWKLKIAETIKTAPLTAPSLLRMSNSNYAFFVPNMTLWEHWNDFLTNCSMIQDTVVSAENKNEVSSLFKVPSIPANLLQIPLKIANGYACPVLHFRFSEANVPSSSTNTSKSKTLADKDLLDALVKGGAKAYSVGEDEVVVPFGKTANVAALNYINNDKLRSYPSGNNLYSNIEWLLFQDELSTNVTLDNPPVRIIESDIKCFIKDSQGVGNLSSPFYLHDVDFEINEEYLVTNNDVTEAYINGLDSITTPQSEISELPTGSISVFTTDYETGAKVKYKVLKNFDLTRFYVYDSVKRIYRFDAGKLSTDSFVLDFLKWYDLSFSGNNGDIPLDFVIGSNTILHVVLNPHHSYGLHRGSISTINICTNPYENETYFTLPCPTHNQYGIYIKGASFDEDGLPYYLYSSDVTQGTSIDFMNSGYTLYAWYVYLCRKVSRHCDFMELPFEGLTVRSFEAYCNMEFNALPFIAYSRIWDKYFRNSQIQSPEFCYKNVNGLMFNNEWHNTFMQSFSDCIFNGSDEKDYYFKDSCWCLPIHTKPLEMTDGVYPVIKIDTMQKAFSLITGICISSLIGANEDFNGIFMPNYYNSLCGIKYKNIGKSIFTAGILEPTNGAKIEEIPDTIIELRSASALQKFWEKTAVARSVKKWYQTIFGTTPSHDDYDEPLLLGKASSEIQIGEILQQSQTTDTAALGERAGVALGGCDKGIAKHYFNEHGWIMIISSTTMDVSFCDGVQQYSFPVHSYLDLPYAQFANIGNEALPVRLLSSVPPPSKSLTEDELNKRLYWDKVFVSNRSEDNYYGIQYAPNENASMRHQFGNEIPNGTLHAWNMERYPITPRGDLRTSDYCESPFSYVPRYSEFKIKLDKCHGEFRSTLRHWVGFQRFTGAVGFTHYFISWEFRARAMGLGRYFVVNDGSSDMFYIDRYNKATCIRSLPYVSTPSN